MQIKLLRKFGHKFFEFIDDGVIRTVCVDGWINANICPGFCKPVLFRGWQPLTSLLEVFDSADSYTVICPTSFGFISNRGAYRKTGDYHMDLVLNKTGLNQFLYNYVIL